MGLIQYLKTRKNKNQYTYADALNGYTPVFSQFGNDIYASDVVQQAINCIVQEMKKLNPRDVRMDGRDPVPVAGRVQMTLDNPNPLMTTSELIEKLTWSLFLNYNAFAFPVRGENGDLLEIYPIQPTTVDFLQDPTGTIFVKMRFANGYETTLPYSSIIHIRHRYSVNDYMGGNEAGQPDNAALLKTLELNDTLLQGVGKALKYSMSINAVVKYNTMMDNGLMADNIKKMEKQLLSGQSGLMPMDIKGEYIPIKRDIQIVNALTLKFVDEKILRNYGVSIPILTGDYTKAQYEAFYQKTLEPIIIALSQGFTKCIFTDGQRAHGRKIMFFSEELIFMTTEQKLEMVRLLGDSGALYENEKRCIFGMLPLPELAGQRKASLNYIDADTATQYQLGQAKQAKEGGEKQDEPE